MQVIVTKRRLNKQQQTRIQNKHDAISSNKASKSADDTLWGQEATGLVTSHYRAAADVECATTGAVVRCHIRANLPALVTGDAVVWRQGQGEQSGHGIIEAIKPRTSELCRPDIYGKMRLVASNITRAIIVIAPEPTAHSNLIDRYIVVAEHLGLEVLLLTNKADLLTPDNPARLLQEKYRALGYSTLAVSSTQNTGMAQLQAHLSGGCSIFVGQSGVGKSSIIQTLLPDEDIKIGELSEAARKGRHTTTHARLYHFPNGGTCIDSPGIREFGLWHLTPNDILQGFSEFKPFIGLCKFRNCTHINDGHCAIAAAANNGEIKQERYQSFIHIVQSLDEVTIQGTKNIKS